MEKDILDTIIETEKEIQETLERERRKSVQWLENTKKAIEAEIAAEVLKLEKSSRETDAAARENARRRAAEILADAAEQCRRLSEISDEKLKKFLMQHMAGIRPENNRDSQDVQS